MGGCLSVNFAGIFMTYVLHNLIKKAGIQSKLLVKCVDDIFVIEDRSQDSVHVWVLIH